MPGETPRYPPHCRSLTHHRVRVADTDMMGIVHHARYVGWLEEGRIEYMRRRGLPYAELVTRGLHLPVVSLSLDYRQSARFDDWLEVETRLARVTRVRVAFAYTVRRPGSHGETAGLLAEAAVGLACINGTGRPCRLPGDAEQALLRAEIAADTAPR